MTGSGSAAPGRRLLVATAVAHYPKAPQWDRPGLTSARQQVIDLFTGVLGYTHVSDLGLDPTGTQLTEHLRTLCRHHVQPEDYLVVYIAGHGEVLDDGCGRHVLLTADTDPDDIADALPTVRLADKMLLGTPVQRLLLLLDTCYSGGGGNQVAAAVLTGMQREWASGSGLVVVTSTQPFEQAETGAFPTLLSAVVQAPSTAGQVPHSLELGGVVQAMNDHPERPAHQRIGWTALGPTGTLPAFLPNPRHRAGMTDIDLHLQQAAEWDTHAQRREVEFRRRFLVPAMAAQGPEQAWWFSGRYVALTDITTWLTQPSPQQAQPFPQDVPPPAATPETHPLCAQALVVTAGPGSGKTAVLGLVSALTHPEHRPTVPIDAIQLPPAAIPPIGAVDVTIYAGGLTHDQVQAGLAAAAQIRAGTIGKLITALNARATASGRPFTAIIDALDEAADPTQLITRVLRPITDHAHGVRLLLGTRPHLLKLLQPPGTPAQVGVIDLDAPPWADRHALTVYTIRNLIEASPDSPYRDAPPHQARSVADAVAAAADPSFLVARITSTTLAAASTIADPADPHWRTSLPRLPGDAMRKDLDTRLGPDAGRARDLLRPLAYAEGQGLPWEDIWAPLASRISGHTYTNDDVRWLRQHAGSYVVEAIEAGRSAYRLYHQVLTEHLRATTAAVGPTDTAIHQAYVDVLTAGVPRTLEATRDWAHAHPYTLRHLATHAAAAGTLDPLLNDAEYLVHADPDTLLPVLDAARSAPARGAAAVYRQSSHLLTRLDRPSRASQLELAAKQFGWHGLAARIASAAPGRPWQTRWSHGRRAAGHQVITGHTGSVLAVAAGELPDGTPVIISGGVDGTVRVWRTADSTPVGEPLTGHDYPVYAVAAGVLPDGTPVIISGGGDGTVRVWRTADGTPVGEPLTGHVGWVNAVAAGVLPDGTPVIISGGGHGTVRVWRTADGTPVGEPLTGHVGWANAVAAGVLPDGTPVIISGSGRDGTVWVWRLADGTPVGEPLTGHDGPVAAVAAGVLPDGTPVIISGGGHGTVGVWRLADGTPVGEPLRGHDGWVWAVAAGVLPDGTPVIISGSSDDTVRVWRLADGTPVGEPLRGHDDSVRAVTAGVLPDGTPVIISGSNDGTVRVWRLADGTPVGEPLRGHDGPVAAVAAGVLPDGTPAIISGSSDRTVRVWRLADGTPVGEPLTGHTGSVLTVAAGVLPDGTPVIISGSSDRTVRVWRLADGTPVGEPLTGHTNAVRAVAAGVLPDGTPVIISSDDGDDGTVRVWRLADGTPVGEPITGFGRVWAVAAGVLPDGTPVMIICSNDDGGGGDDRRLRLWFLADGTVRVRRLADGTPVGEPLTGHDGSVYAVATGVLPDGTLVIISGGRDGTVRVWRLADGTPFREPLHGHAGSVLTVTAGLLPDGTPVIISGGSDRAVRVRRLADGTPGVPPLDLLESVQAVAVHGNVIVTAAGSSIAVHELALPRPTR